MSLSKLDRTTNRQLTFGYGFVDLIVRHVTKNGNFEAEVGEFGFEIFDVHERSFSWINAIIVERVIVNNDGTSPSRMIHVVFI